MPPRRKRKNKRSNKTSENDSRLHPSQRGPAEQNTDLQYASLMEDEFAEENTVDREAEGMDMDEDMDEGMYIILYNFIFHH